MRGVLDAMSCKQPACHRPPSWTAPALPDPRCSLLACCISGQPPQPGSQQDEDEDCDYLLQDSKRRKLQQRRKAGGAGAGGRGGRRAGRAKGADPEADVVELSDSDSDRRLLQAAAARGKADRDTATSLAPGAVLPGPPGGAGARAGTSGAAHAAATDGGTPGLDPNTSALLQQVQELKARMRAAQEQAELSDEGDEGSEGVGERGCG